MHCKIRIHNEESYTIFSAGVALALLKIPGQALQGQYFDKYYPLARGVCSACGALGIIVFPPVTQILLDTYGWRNTLLLLGGIYLHMIVSGIMFRSPLPKQKFSLLKTHDLDDDNNPCLETNASEHFTFKWINLSTSLERAAKNNFECLHRLGLQLFTKFSFLANCAAAGSASCTFTGWVIYFVPHCLTKGLSPQEASLLASIAGFAYLLGPFVYVPIVSKGFISARGYIYISFAVESITHFADPFCSTFATTLLSSSCFTFSYSAGYPLLDVCLKSVVDEDDLSKAFGWRAPIIGVFRILSGFVVGKFM